jgi:hypothetical protein
MDSSQVDAEVEAFANTAFDHLLETGLSNIGDSEAPKSADRNTERKLARASVAAKSSMPPRPTVDAEVERLQSEVERQKTENARLERELTSARGDLERLRADGQGEAAANEQVVRLQRELDDVRLKAASGQKVGGVSSREFLDLREAVNKKEKEVLVLRDQIMRKEKELLDASDSALVVERDKADLEDKIAILEKEVQAAKSFAESARADKEQAAKRAEDFKTRGEKVKLELETKSSELATIHKRHEEETAAALSQLREAEHRLRDQALAQQKQEADLERATSLGTLEGDLRREADERLSTVRTELEARLLALQTESDERLASLQRESDERLASLKKESGERLASLDRDAEDRLSTLRRDADAQLAALRNEMDERLASLTSSSSAEQERLKAELSQALEDSATSKSRLAAREGELDQMHRNALEAQRAELESRHAHLLRESEGRASEIATELSTRTEEREVLAREVQQLRDRVGRLETDLAQRHTDLAETRSKLAEQTARVEMVAAKWAENRASLDQAKDALAAAVAQIEEAEARGI